MRLPIPKKKVLFSLFLSYWIVLLCALLASFLIYSSAVSALNKEIERVEYVSLKNIQSVLDSRLRDIKTTGFLLSIHNHVRPVVHAKKPLEDVSIKIMMMRTRQLFFSAMTNNRLVSDIYLYSYNSRIFLSTQYGLNEETAIPFQAQDALGISVENLKTLLDDTRARYVILPEPTPGDEKQIIFLMPVLTTGIKPEGMLIIKLNSEKFYDLAQTDVQANRKTLFIVDPSGQAIEIANPDQISIKMDTFEWKDQSTTYVENENSYIMSSISSTQSDWKYITLADIRTYKQSIRQVQKVTGIFLISFFTLGTIASILLSKRQYTPVQRLISQVRKISPAGTEAENEYLLVEKVIQTIYQEKEHYSHRFEQQQSEMRQAILYRLMKGTYRVNQSTQDLLYEADIRFENNYFLVILMTVDDFGILIETDESDELDTGDVSLAYSIIQNVMLELLIVNNPVFIAESETSAACLVNVASCDQDVLANVGEGVEQGLRFMNQYFKMKITTGISSIRPGLSSIADAYREAQEALEFARIYDQPGTLRFYEAAKKEGSTHKGTFSLEQRKLLINYLVAYDYESAEQYAMDVMREGHLVSKQMSGGRKDAYRLYQYDLIGILSAAVDDLATACNDEHLMQASKMISELVSSNHLSEQEKYLHEYFNLLRIMKQEKENDLFQDEKLKEIIQVIQDHASEPDLSVTRVAEWVDLSVSQVTRILRANLGMGTLDFIQKTRIDKAKELLAETDLSIKEIAYRVGYYNYHTMNVTFKKLEGITGSQFRQHIRKAGKKKK